MTDTTAAVDKCLQELRDHFDKTKTPKEVGAIAMTLLLHQLQMEGYYVEQRVVPIEAGNAEVH